LEAVETVLAGIVERLDALELPVQSVEVERIYVRGVPFLHRSCVEFASV
jgi:hypothetical protein